MKMPIKLIFLLFSFIQIFTSGLLAQSFIYTNVKELSSARNAPYYQSVREADIMWSKVVWRQIDLNEKINQGLYFPTTPMNGCMSMIDVLLDGVYNHGLTVYAENDRDEFGTILTATEVRQRLGEFEVTVSSDVVGEENPYTYTIPYTVAEVKSYLVKEIWFFDKRRSVIDMRIIGLCPVRVYFKDEDLDQEYPIKRKVFWVYYPEIRKLLSTKQVTFDQNNSSGLSYSDIFEKRFFSGFVIAESNLYNNRWLSEYTSNMEILHEAENIKQNIFNLEQDLWEY